MNHRSVPRIGRLLCGLASAFALGLLAVPASAQGDTSTVSFTVGPYLAFEFLSPPSVIAIVVPDGGTLGTYVGSRPFRVRSNVGWGFGAYSFSAWVPGPPPYVLTPSGVPFAGGPGQTLGTLTVTASGLTFPTPPQVRTGLLTVTLYQT